MAEVEFETIISEDIEFGNNNFLEIARKKAKTNDSENEFISISRGFFTPEKEEKRFRKSIAFPVDADIVDAVIDALKKIGDELPSEPKATAETKKNADETKADEEENISD